MVHPNPSQLSAPCAQTSSSTDCDELTQEDDTAICGYLGIYYGRYWQLGSLFF